MAAPDQPPSEARFIAETVVLVLLVLGFVLASALVEWGPAAPSKGSREGIGIFVAAALTLIMYSFLYRDNPLFKIAENLYVGVGLGYSVVISWHQYFKMEIYNPLLNAPSRGAFIEAVQLRTVPILLGILLLTRLSTRVSWLSRYAYSLMVGWYAGVFIPFAASSFILTQLEASVRPVGTEVGAIAGAVVVLVGTVSVLFYFFFSVEHKGPAGAVSRAGIWFLMVSFGASFGYTVMGRLSLFIGRARFLLTQWLGISL
ncbi:MAG: hypothetical protein ACLF0G_13900 [Candidatus Brocadiia bacterium]